MNFVMPTDINRRFYVMKHEDGQETLIGPYPDRQSQARAAADISYDFLRDQVWGKDWRQLRKKD